MNWYLKVIKQYADFNGRARRTEYWMFTTLNALFAFICLFLDYQLGLGSTPVIYSIYLLATAIPTLAVMVRRLHDVNKSGWMFLINFIPLIGFFWFLILTLKSGTVGENKYGVDPKAETETI
jgi:uncharacterized membrane protein YhaH (DUF805 family)